MIIEIINESFGGDVKDKRSLHINSICRIAYSAVLYFELKETLEEIAYKTNTTRGNVKHRLHKHRNMYEFDKIYKTNYNNLIEKI
jgi:hypothetical protein